MKIMFLDESGNHALIGGDPAYPVFVLGGIIADADYVAEVIDPRIRRFKRDLFGREDLVLHTADITRNKNGFEQLKEPNFRKRFYEELNRLMMELEYMVVACVIKQDDVLAQYGMAAVDPYLLSLDILVERFCFEIGDVPESGRIVAEKRSPVLDRELDIAWLNLKVQGTKFIKANTLNERITNLLTLPKSANVAGLQLADLVVSPIGRFVLGKPLKQDWAVVESKFRRQDGRYKGAGLVVLPDTEEMN